MKVSVIIPTYGHPRFLVNCINSVLSQTLKDFELIIVDDNNPGTKEREETAAIVDSFVEQDSRVQYIKHPRNLNGATARNTGISAAKGDFISFLDSDDEYYPERLHKCYESLKEADITFAGVYTGCEFKKSGKTYHIGNSVASGNYLVKTLACTFGLYTGSNLFIRRSVVDELNGFDTAFLRHQDYEFLVRLFENYSLLALPEILVIKNNENFNLPNVEKLISIKKQYISKFSPIIEGLSDKDKNYILFSHSLAIAEAAQQTNKYQLAKEYYNKARSYGKLTLKQILRMFLLPIYGLLK